MTTLREAAKQALEAMSSFESGTNGLYEGEFAEEIAALKAALVEDAMQKFTDVNQELEAALAEPENWELRRLREELERCKQVCAATSEAWREEAALAEPVPGQGCDHCNQPLYAAIKCRVCGRETPIIEPKIKRDNKPVAWIHTDPDKPRVRFLEWRENEPGYRGDWIKTPLYAAPPQRKPLTEEEIEKAYREIWRDLSSDFDHTSAGWIEMGIKYAERAHGIGEQQ